jgi:hypothetical protein
MLDPDLDQMNTDPKHWFQIRIQIRKGKNDPLDVLYGGLGISKLQFMIKKKYIFQLKIFSMLVIKTLDPDPDSMNREPKHCLQVGRIPIIGQRILCWSSSQIPGSGSGFNESGSKTLLKGERD